MTRRVPKSKPARDIAFSDELGLERLIFFSDAVFAIAITLLALDIHLPAGAVNLTNAQLRDQLLGLWSHYLSYAISFLVIGRFWFVHHRRFRDIKRYDGRLLVLNLWLLMVIAFVPFPTSVLSEYSNRTATIFYALTMIALSLLSSLTSWYAWHNHHLVSDDLDLRVERRHLLSGLLVPLIFLISIGIAFVDSDIARFSWLLIALSNLFK